MKTSKYGFQLEVPFASLSANAVTFGCSLNGERRKNIGGINGHGQ